MIDNSIPHIEPAPASQPETADAEPPRFIVGLQRYEEYLKSAQVPGVTTEQRAHNYGTIIQSCGGLTQAAQTFEFMSTIPDLANTSAIDTAAMMLANELQNPSVPAEVRAIYWSLFGGDVGQYIDPNEL